MFSAQPSETSRFGDSTWVAICCAYGQLQSRSWYEVSRHTLCFQSQSIVLPASSVSMEHHHAPALSEHAAAVATTATPFPSIHAQLPATDFTMLPWPCRHALIATMDSQMRGAWRLVNMQACSDMYEATRRLTWRAGPRRAPSDGVNQHAVPSTTLPSALLAKLPALKELDCSGLCNLLITDSLPPGIEAFVCHTATYGFGAAFAPVPLRPTLRMLSVRGACFLDLGVLSPCSALTKLELIECPRLDDNVQQLAQSLPDLTVLRHLSLASHALRTADAQALGPSIASLSPHLRHLDLADTCRLGPEALLALGPTLQVGKCLLRA